MRMKTVTGEIVVATEARFFFTIKRERLIEG